MLFYHFGLLAARPSRDVGLQRPLPDSPLGGVLSPVHLSSRTGQARHHTHMCSRLLHRLLRLVIHHSPFFLSCLPHPPPRPPSPHSLPFFLAALSILQTISHRGLNVALPFHPWKPSPSWSWQPGLSIKTTFQNGLPPSRKTQKFSFPTTTSRSSAGILQGMSEAVGSVMHGAGSVRVPGRWGNKAELTGSVRRSCWKLGVQRGK